jgi:outer membrane protein OmpA-like peptidoglycan-associated protein
VDPSRAPSASAPAAPTHSGPIHSSDCLIRIDAINSPARDNTPLISANGRIMFFNSTRRGDREWAHFSPMRGRYDDDIYYSFRVGGTDHEEIWSEPVNLGPTINSSEDDGVAAISPDGRTIYFVSLKRGWADDGGPFYRADLHGTEWSNIRGLGGGITRFFTTAADAGSLRIYGGSISPDGKDFYFATTAHSDGGRHQIWVAHSQGGAWQVPENLGPDINQPAGSYAPFIAADGKTLYFSTHMAAGGLGGDDIHYTVYNGGVWSKPVNIGAPINSDADDAFLSIPASGDRVYIATSREGNDDIYMTELPRQAQPDKVVLLTGTVMDQASGKPLGATISVEDRKTRSKIFQTTADPATGSYTVIVPSGGDYDIGVGAPGYGTAVNSYSAARQKHYVEESRSFSLDMLPTESYVLKDVSFEYGTAALPPQADAALHELIDTLRRTPSLRISLDGYTDSIGSLVYNRTLSFRRASAVRSYLVNVGRINPSRLAVQGYGSDKPIASNETEEGRKKNRRVEYSILATKPVSVATRGPAERDQATGRDAGAGTGTGQASEVRH